MDDSTIETLFFWGAKAFGAIIKSSASIFIKDKEGQAIYISISFKLFPLLANIQMFSANLQRQKDNDYYQ